MRDHHIEFGSVHTARNFSTNQGRRSIFPKYFVLAAFSSAPSLVTAARGTAGAAGGVEPLRQVNQLIDSALRPAADSLRLIEILIDCLVQDWK